MKQPYFKPVITQIELRPVEAAVYGCKTTLDEQGVKMLGGHMGCYDITIDNCRDVIGS